MKRKWLFALASVSFLVPAASFAGGPEIIIEPDYFSGFFIGGTGAFHQAGFGGSSSSSTSAPTEVVSDLVIETASSPLMVHLDQVFFPGGTLLANTIDGNGYDGFYGVQGGVGKVFNHRWYIGVVGFGEWGSQSDTDVSSADFQTLSYINIIRNDRGQYRITLDQEMSTAGTYNSSTSVKIFNDYGVAFKPGFLVAPRSLVYGKIGAVWADLKVSNSFTGNSFSQLDGSTLNPNAPLYTAQATISGSSSNKQNQIALLLGAGFEQFIYRDFVTINFEYNYANYGHVSTSANLNGNGSIIVSPQATGAQSTTIPVTLNNVGVAEASANVRVSTFLAGLNFYFGSHWF